MLKLASQVSVGYLFRNSRPIILLILGVTSCHPLSHYLLGPSLSIFSIKMKWLRKTQTFSIKICLKKCALMRVANNQLEEPNYYSYYLCIYMYIIHARKYISLARWQLYGIQSWQYLPNQQGSWLTQVNCQSCVGYSPRLKFIQCLITGTNSCFSLHWIAIGQLIALSQLAIQVLF